MDLKKWETVFAQVVARNGRVTDKEYMAAAKQLFPDDLPEDAKELKQEFHRVKRRFLKSV